MTTPREHLVARLRAMHDQLVGQIVKKTAGAVPEYGALSEARASRVERTVGFIVRGGTELLEQDEVVSGALIEAVRREGAQRAADGLSLKAVRSSAHIGFTEIRTVIRAALLELTPTEELLRFILDLQDWLRDFESAVIDSMIAGHLDHHIEVDSEPVRARRRFVSLLLQDIKRSERDTLAARFGYNDNTAFGLVSLAERGASSQATWLLRSCGANLAANLDNALAGPIETTPTPHVVVVVAVATAEDWQRALDAVADEVRAHGLVAVVLEPVNGFASVSQRHNEARDLIGLACAVAQRPRLFTPKDLTLSRVTQCLPPDLVKATLGRIVTPLQNLEPGERRQLVAALRALHNKGHNVSSAAKELGITHGRMRSIVARLEHVLGVRLDDPEIQFNVALAIHWPGLASAESP